MLVGISADDIIVGIVVVVDAVIGFGIVGIACILLAPVVYNNLVGSLADFRYRGMVAVELNCVCHCRGGFYGFFIFRICK